MELETVVQFHLGRKYGQILACIVLGSIIFYVWIS